MTTFVKHKKEIFMKSEPFVPTELHAKASAELEKEIQEELLEKDPAPEKASAALKKAIEDDDEDDENVELVHENS